MHLALAWDLPFVRFISYFCGIFSPFLFVQVILLDVGREEGAYEARQKRHFSLYGEKLAQNS